MPSLFTKDMKKRFDEDEKKIIERLKELGKEYGPIDLGVHKIEVIFRMGVAKYVLKVTQVDLNDKGEPVLRGSYTDMATGEMLTDQAGSFIPLQTDPESLLYVLDASERALEDRGIRL